MSTTDELAPTGRRCATCANSLSSEMGASGYAGALLRLMTTSRATPVHTIQRAYTCWGRNTSIHLSFDDGGSRNSSSAIGSGSSGKKRTPRAANTTPSGGWGVCTAYCATASIRVSRVQGALSSLDGGAQLASTPTVGTLGEVAHAKLRIRQHGALHDAHVFFFASGASVFWDVPTGVRRRVLSAVQRATASKRRALRMTDFDHEFAVVRNDAPASFLDDAISVPVDAPVRQLLAISHGLAQSVELLTLERAIDLLVARTRALPATLAATGRSGMRSDEIRRLLGELLAARYELSLVSDVLDVPEYFWQNADLEALYDQCVAAVELRARARILETRVIVIRDALDMLNGELRADSSQRVERAILALIAVEVAMEVAKLVRAGML